jgi:transposase InsO family protein
MPWKESCAMDERTRFVGEHLSGDWTMVELCERYEISRKSGYKWLGRYHAKGPAGLEERSCKPHVHGRATPQHLVEAIVGLREQRGSWGPRKIIAALSARNPDEVWPSPSTAGEILKRAGHVKGRRFRRHGPPRLGELTVPQCANHVWGVDHKGWVRLRDGSRVEPLTMTDSFSRYLISVAATSSPTHDQAKPLFDRAFREHGLPEVIRSDNGTPFASTGTTGLTALSVWWIKLGIKHERIIPSRMDAMSACTSPSWRPCSLLSRTAPPRLAASKLSPVIITRSARMRRLVNVLQLASISARPAACPSGFRNPSIQARRRSVTCAQMVRSNGRAISSIFVVHWQARRSPLRRPRMVYGRSASSTRRSG